MNFDDLHDPSPPEPGAAALAAVAARAKTLRRRRTAFSTAGAVAVLAVVAVPVALSLDGDDTHQMTPATLPATTVEPAPTAAPTTSVPPTGPTTTSSPPTTTSVPPTTEPADSPRPMVVAVRADGVAVIVDEDGTTTVLKGLDDGFPAGLPVRTVLLTPDGRAFAAGCCLPVSSPDEETARWGEFLVELDRPGAVRSIDATATRLALVRDLGVAITELDGTDVATGRPAGDSTVTDVAFLPDGRLAVSDLYVSDETGFVGRLHVVDGDLSTLSSSTGVVLGPVEGNGTWQLAGVDALGNVLVSAGGEGAFDGSPQGFDPSTLEEVATTATTGIDTVATAWFADGVGTWVDMDGALWHDGERIADGPFTWARPA